jgi:hypothetical protein
MTTNFWLPNPADIADGDTLRWDATLGRFTPVAFPSSTGPSAMILAAPVDVNDGNFGTLFTIAAADIPANNGFFAILTVTGGESSGPGNVLQASARVLDDGVTVVSHEKFPSQLVLAPDANVNAFFGDQENVTWTFALSFGTQVTGDLEFQIGPVGANLRIEPNVSGIMCAFLPP